MNMIERNIRNLSDDELIRMVSIECEQYTDEALFIARDEMKTRNIPELEPEAEAENDSAGNGDTKQPRRDAPERLRKLGEIEALSQDRARWLEFFLADELKYLESCNAILDFVTSMNIRNGEYEGEVTVIKKMDFNNFILYAESIGENKFKSISGCVAIGKDELVEKISETARRNGVELEVKAAVEY